MALKFGSPAWRKKYVNKNAKRKTARRKTAKRKATKNPTWKKPKAVRIHKGRLEVR